jgi:hypothetical protein
VKVGDSISFLSVDGERRAAARIVHIAPDVDPLSDLVLAEGSLEQQDAELHPGFPGYVVVDFPSH